MYNVYIIKSAQKDIKSLPKREVSEILEKITTLKNNPRPYDCKKLIGSANTYRIRKGTYRILYTIEDKIKEITVYKVDHRKDVYR
ncbi:MAG: type II toxin-antitoxin system RelE/ParE family toxin [bacterium]|nr:type II toxin-antitoxin system RelE/ParE family toxin [Candidatus Margulisiibacteriota bacterium]